MSLLRPNEDDHAFAAGHAEAGRLKLERRVARLEALLREAEGCPIGPGLRERIRRALAMSFYDESAERVKKAEVAALPVPPPPYPPPPYPPTFYGYPPPPGYVPPPPAQLAPNPAPAPVPVMENPAACGCVWEESPHEREARRVRARAFGEWIEQVRALTSGNWGARQAVQAFESGMAPEEFVKLHAN